MKKRTFSALTLLALSLVLSLAAAPASYANAMSTEPSAQESRCRPEDSILAQIPEGYEIPAGELTKSDIQVAPAKKTIRPGQSFSISFKAARECEYSWMDKEEFRQLILENIDSIEYRSEKSGIASVGRYTGKVTGIRRGYTVIRTTVYLSSGESATFKTRVYVTSGGCN